MGKKLTLKVEGEELTKKDIKERFDKYNKMYFGGKLGKCEILWGLVNNADYGAYHAYEKEDGLHSRIWVGRNTIWTEEGLRELLVHEMIHMYVRTVEGKRMDGLFGVTSSRQMFEVTTKNAHSQVNLQKYWKLYSG